jgi:hypothetical protein
MTEIDNQVMLEQAQLLEDMSKDYWELVNQETRQMFTNTQRLNGLTVRAIALQAGARALRTEATKEQE